MGVEGGRLGAETSLLDGFFKAIPEAAGIGFIYSKGWANDPLQPRDLEIFRSSNVHGRREQNFFSMENSII